MTVPSARLAGADGSVLELEIIGYQYPNHPAERPEDWDANWLVIRGRVETAAVSWTFIDPCLTTWEAAGLAAWLDEVVAAAPHYEEAPDSMWFTEPLLTFALTGSQDDRLVIRVGFDLEARPPGHPPEPGELSVDFDVEIPQVAGMAETLRDQLEGYPVRSGGPEPA